MNTKLSTQYQSREFFHKKDIATTFSLALTIGLSCYFLYLLSGKYYAPLSDFFAFKSISEKFLNFNISLGGREPVYPLLMGIISLIIPAKKAILYAGILISSLSYLCSIFLVHKISQQVGIKNSFLVSWFFAFSTLSLYCATQPILEATILFLILLSFFVSSDKSSLYISGIATFTRYDAVLAAIANLPKIIVKKKWHLKYVVFFALLPAAIWAGFDLFVEGKGGYIRMSSRHKQFVINKKTGNLFSMLRNNTLYYLPEDHPAAVGPERFHNRWWVQLIWIVNIFVVFTGASHLIKLKNPHHLSVLSFSILYILFLWYHPYTSWRLMCFTVWIFPLYTIAGIEYFLARWQHQKKIILILLLGILGIIVIYNAYKTPFIKNLYQGFFSLSFEINSFKNFLLFLPVCVYVFFKTRQSRSKGYLVLLPLFLLLTPLVSSHIATVNNMYGGLWDLKAGLNAAKEKVKNEELIFMPKKMVFCATYLSDIPEKNIVTYHTEDLLAKDIRYIASYRAWDRDPVLNQLENNPKTVIIGNQMAYVIEIYHAGQFRLFSLVERITVCGNVQIDTAKPKFGNASILFDGAGSRLQIADSPDWTFRSEDFTIDFWVSFSSISGTQVLIGNPYYSPNKEWQIAWEEEFKSLKFAFSTDGSNNTDVRFHWSPSKDRWHHIAVVRKNSDLKAFVNGLQIGKTYNMGSTSIFDSTDPLYSGSRGIEEHFNGWLDEIRISKGIARWKAGFTPPSNEYATDSYTKLLLHGNDTDKW